MTKMSKAQRTAILDFHNGNRATGFMCARRPTLEVMAGNGWALQLNGSPAYYVTRAGLIAAGVDMDAIHAEALIEHALSRAEANLAVAIADERRRLLACGFRNVDPMALNNVMGRLHAEALVEDFERGQAPADTAPAHVRDDCPALPVGCRRCTAPMTIKAARAAAYGQPDPYATGAGRLTC